MKAGSDSLSGLSLPVSVFSLTHSLRPFILHPPSLTFSPLELTLDGEMDPRKRTEGSSGDMYAIEHEK